MSVKFCFVIQAHKRSRQKIRPFDISIGGKQKGRMHASIVHVTEIPS